MDTVTPSPLPHAMIEAALKGAHIALKRRQESDFHADVKMDDGFASLVTKGDLQSEQVIRASLEANKPQILAALGMPPDTPVGFIMEESAHNHHDGAPIAEKRKHGVNFVVDPVDGTYGYSYPQRDKKVGDQPFPWCVSIGLEVDGKTVAAAVYEAGDNEWQVDASGKRLAYDHEHPSGKVFWADKRIDGAYRIDAPAGGFTVASAPPAAYEEVGVASPDGEKIALKDATLLTQQLTVDYSRGASQRLSADTPIEPGVPAYTGDFRSDRNAGQTENGPVISAVREAIAGLGHPQERAMSAVASCMRVADGRSAGFAHGCLFPWDDSAARLILEKAEVPFIQYETPHSGHQMTTIVASRNPALYDDLTEALASRKNVTGAIVGAHGISRREMLGTLGAATLAAFLPWTQRAAGTSPPVAANANQPRTIDHVPRTLDELYALTDEQKILLAAATASGCDAVAYYTPGAQPGTFSLQQHIDLYPASNTAFAPALNQYNPHSFTTEEAVIANAEYHIPVYAVDNQGKATDTMKGVIVLHAPTDRYSRLQPSAGIDDKSRASEPSSIRKAKLDMAKFIVGEHQDLFGVSGQMLSAREQHHLALPEKERYFIQVIKRMFDTFTKRNEFNIDDFNRVHAAKDAHELKAALRKITPWYDSDQAPHVLGVTDLMEYAVDKAVNRDGKVISDRQKDLLLELTLLHDIGKTQMSSAFLRAWQVPDDPQEQAARDKYFAGQNHNHPLFTLMTMLLYKNDGITAASHHHGVFRYGNDELRSRLGDDFGKFHILADNIPPQDLPALSKIMRVCDVTEAITGNPNADQPVHIAMMELAQKAGYDPRDKSVKPVSIEPGSIDPDYLCFLIDNGVFHAYGQQRATENAEGWVVRKTPRREGDVPAGTLKYTAAEVDRAGQEILEAFHWKERKVAVEQEIRQAVANDKLLRENPDLAPERAAPAQGR